MVELIRCSGVNKVIWLLNVLFDDLNGMFGGKGLVVLVGCVNLD